LANHYNGNGSCCDLGLFIPLTSSPLQVLIAQFQSRYPNAGLISELLTIHEGSYVVRASVQLGGMMLATGMATAVELEQAEDRAKIRALEAIGIQSATAATDSATQTATSPVITPKFQTTELPSSAPAYNLPDTPEPAKTDPIAASSYNPVEKLTTASPAEIKPRTADSKPPAIASSASLLDWDAPSLSADMSNTAPLDDDWQLSDYSTLPLAAATSSQQTIEDYSAIADSTPQDLFDQNPLPAPTSPANPATSEKTPKRRTTKKPQPVIEPEEPSPDDRSDELAKIWVEMKRLGWTKEQGRDYLKQTYGKRSRQELDDDELIDFLRYLELQPTPTNTPTF
jgi:hypothetical protein